MQFNATSYSVTEGNSVLVCLTFSGSIPSGYRIQFSISAHPGTAQPLGKNSKKTGERKGSKR